jgi:integrase/recombinase XerD
MTQPNLDSPLGLRDRAILETLYSTGMRRAVVADLSLHAVATARGALPPRHGKGDKQRVVPIGQRALTWLLAYMENARPLLLVDRRETRLFITKNGKRFVPNALSDLVKKHMRSAGITKGGSCHLFRHTAATFMLENGADVRYIQALLGHADLNATQIYTHVSIAKLREVHDRTHPARNKPEAQARRPEEEDGDLATV